MTWDSQWSTSRSSRTDGDKLKGYYAELFGLGRSTPTTQMNYGIVPREGNRQPRRDRGRRRHRGGPDGYEGHVTFYVAVPRRRGGAAKAESLGGTRMMGPETIMGGVELGQFTQTPRAT